MGEFVGRTLRAGRYGKGGDTRTFKGKQFGGLVLGKFTSLLHPPFRSRLRRVTKARGGGEDSTEVGIVVGIPLRAKAIRQTGRHADGCLLF